MNKRYKSNFIQAGAFANQVRSYGKSLIKPGASYNDVLAKINHKILELGAIPAFPPQIALNDVAAHFLFQPGKDLIFSNEVVKLDVGVCYEGAIGDCAVTVDLSGKYAKLVEAAEAALLNAEKSIKVGQKVKDIGKIIEDTILSYGFKPIRNLSGHGLGPFQIHTPPLIPNYADNSKAFIRPGMTFAIEPFATDGAGEIFETGEAAIFSFIKQKPVKSDTARVLLQRIKEFQGLPFATHDLLKTGLPIEEIMKGLSELTRERILFGHAPLVEKKHGMVAQAENSVLVDEHGQVFITTR